MAFVSAARERARGDLVRLTHRGLGLPEFSRAVTRTLRKVVPFEGSCMLTMDPATLLPTSHVVEDALPLDTLDRLNEIELGEPDFNKFTELARAAVPASGLAEATQGDLDQSLRQRELRRPSGFGDELRTVLSDSTGTWGALTLLREQQRPNFTTADVRFLASLARPLADGLRRAMLRSDATLQDGVDDGPGLLVLAPDSSVEESNNAADRFLDELGMTDERVSSLPTVVVSVATVLGAAATGVGRPARGCRPRPVAGSPYAAPSSVTVRTRASRSCSTRPAHPSSHG